MPTERFRRFRELQENLRERVRLVPMLTKPRCIVAVDLHVGRGSLGHAAAVAVNASGETLDRVVVPQQIEIPYVPGFLSFRELPLCIAAVERLSVQPDVVLLDGHGIAHPRRFGIACHFGVEMNVPAIGIAKSLLTGEGREPGRERGETADLVLDGEVVGKSVRTRSGVKPLYISPGHLVTIENAVDLVLSLCTRFRLPEPSREAHRLAREAARDLTIEAAGQNQSSPAG